MASPALQAKYLKAGEEYLAALVRFGMRPLFVGWAWEFATEQWFLVVVTSIVEAGGALALNKLLFRAYNAGATPKEISPFSVRVFSPEVANAGMFIFTRGAFISDAKDRYGRPKKILGENGKPIEIIHSKQTFLGMEIDSDNSFPIPVSPSEKYQERRQEWSRFKRNVERLAA